MQLTNSERECLAAPIGYDLPKGWTWETVSEQRAAWEIAPIYLPLVNAAGVATVWGVPMINGRPVRHRLEDFQ